VESGVKKFSNKYKKIEIFGYILCNKILWCDIKEFDKNHKLFALKNETCPRRNY
jgi:hypothetical protein